MPTVQETAITNLQNGVRAEYALYRYDDAPTDFNPNGIATGFLPAGWTEVDTASGSGGAEFAHDGIGGTITFTVHGYRRVDWPDAIPLCLIARWWDGSAWSDWKAMAWGYVTGAGRVRTDRATGDVTGTITATIVKRWDKLPVPGLAFGRANLAAGATSGYAVTTLADPEELVPGEFAYQDDTSPAKAVDGNIDTVAAGEPLAATETLQYGDFTNPRIASFFGPHDPGVAVGGVPRFIQLAFTHNATAWGVDWTGIPEMYNAGAGEGQAAVRDDGKIATSVVTYGDGTKGFRVRSYQQANPKADTWVQWIVGSTGRPNVPMRVRLDLRATSGGSVGKHLLLGVGTAEPVAMQNNVTVELGADWQTFIFDFDSSTDYAGAKVSIKTTPGELLAGDVYYDIRNLKVLFGWDHDEYAKRNDYKALYLGMDDGAGHEKWQRIAFDLAPGGNFNIAPESTLVIADDAAALRAAFAPGRATVFQMKNAFKFWHFEPGIGRLRLALMNNPPDTNNIDALPGGAVLIEDINFATNGLTWTPTQMMVRKSPFGTGSFVADDFPSIGFGEQYGSGWWTFDLGAFAAPTLQEAAGIGDTVLYVSSTRPFQESGTVRVQAEDLAYSGKEEGTLFLTGAVATAHAAGLAVTPLHDGSIGSGTSPQTAKTWDYLEVRRREGVPPIRNGVIFGSKLASPGDPSAGGSKWERHPDWFPIYRFRDNSSPVISVHAPAKQTNAGATVSADQLRHIGLAVDVMGRDDLGRSQHPMVNEIVVNEWVPESGPAGAYASADSGDLTGIIGHLLVKYGGLAPDKFISTLPAVPLGTLTVTPTTLSQALQSATGQQLARLWVDGLGYATLQPGPNSLLFDAQDAVWTWTEENCWGAVVEGERSEANAVAQVVVYAREPGTLRHHTVSYPAVRLPLGTVTELKDIVVASRAQAEELAVAAFRDGNARRSITIQAGACPWLAPYQRHIVNLPNLDSSGDWAGVNMYVAAYSTKFIALPSGGTVNRTAITLREMAL